MGAARRLQADIDRTLKKVQEGMHEFDQIWEKVYDTENANQREKYEGDLKKEIKKLQRLRDQIKTWIASSDIKDKTSLVDARKAIEREMERFKVCEKEAKTKTYSKAGLGQAAKVDPEEKAKQDQRDWLNDQVEALKQQVDEFESELESISNASKKSKKVPERKSHLEDSVGRHKQHITRLEQLMRCLDNSTVNPEEVSDVKDMVEWYMESNQEEFESFADTDSCYEPLLDRLNAVVMSAPATQSGMKKTKDKDRTIGEDDRDRERERDRERGTSAVAKQQVTASGLTSARNMDGDEEKTEHPGRTVSASHTPADLNTVGANSTAALANNGAGSILKGSASADAPGAAKEDGGGTGGAVTPKQTWQVGPNIGLSTSASAPIPLPDSQNGPAHSGANATTADEQDPGQQSLVSSHPIMASSPIKVPAPAQLKPQPESNAASSVGSAGAVSFASALAGIRPAGPPPVAAPPTQSSPPIWGVGSGDDSGFPQLAAANLMERRPSRTDQTLPDQKRILTRLQQMDINGTSQTPSTPPSTSPAAQAGPLATQKPGAGPQQMATNQQASSQYPAGASNPDPNHNQPASESTPPESQAPLQPSNLGQQPQPPPVGQGSGATQDVLESSHLSSIVDLNQLIHELSLDNTRPEGGGMAAAPGQYENNPAQSLQTLHACCRRSMPQPGDSDYKTDLSNHANRVTPHLPASYPIHRLPQLDDGNFFQKIDQEALFFAFYYQPGSIQQFLAARELKRQSWRYNKEHKAWFQRSGEPKATTKDYEQGSYVYFDKTFSPDNSDNPADVNGWCYRKKDNFTFRYDQLEDELQ